MNVPLACKLSIVSTQKSNVQKSQYERSKQPEMVSENYLNIEFDLKVNLNYICKVQYKSQCKTAFQESLLFFEMQFS